MEIALHSFIEFLKNFIFLLFRAKYEIAQLRYFLKNRRTSKCIISDSLRDISRCRPHEWNKESKVLTDKNH